MKVKPKTIVEARQVKTKSGRSGHEQDNKRSLYLASLLDNISDALISTDMEFNVLEWNAAAEKLYGWRAAEVTGHPLEEFIQSEYTDGTTREDAIKAVLEEKVWKGELSQSRKDGTRFPVIASMSLLKDNTGMPIGFLAINRDVIERRQAAEKLNQSELRYRRLFETAKDGILILNAETGMIVDVNPFLITLLGYSKEVFLGKTIWELGFFKDIVANKANFLELQQREYIRYEDLPLKTAHGQKIHVEFVSNVYEVDHQKVIQCNIRNITERRHAEEKIIRQNAYLTALHDIDLAIVSAEDMRTSLNILLSHTVSLMAVDAAAVSLLNPTLDRLEFAAGLGFLTHAIEGAKIRLGEGLAGKAVVEQKVIQIPNLAEEPGAQLLANLLKEERFISYYGLPLTVKGKVIGMLEVFHRAHLEHDQDWLDFLSTLAGQAAIAIDNAQLFDDLQRSNIELEERVKKRTAELDHTNTQLERANRVKDEFLANMSHELRTPLASILGLSEFLLEQRRGPLNESQQKSVQIISSSGSHLLELINDILDLSKIEAGKFDYYPQVISINDVCRSSLAFVESQAFKKSITLNYSNEASVPGIFADPRRLKQILVNLLTNAVKFTPENGEVTMAVNTDLEQEIIQFSVTDNGIGIASEDLKRLFIPFVQLDSKLNRQFEGTGLGLALAQKLTDLHGGSIKVESEFGKGSRFTVNLQCNQNAAEQLGRFHTANSLPVNERDGITHQPGGQGSSATHHKILLAEDNEANVLTVSEYLESYGYEMLVANDGLQAIEMAQAAKPELILMDIQMPFLNGLEAIQRLRANPRFAATPIIALTAIAMVGDRERCLQAGANEYLSKPVNLKELRQLIETFLV